MDLVATVLFIKEHKLYGCLIIISCTVHILFKILKIIAAHLFCGSGSVWALTSEAAAWGITAAHYSCMLFEWQLISWIVFCFCIFYYTTLSTFFPSSFLPCTSSPSVVSQYFEKNAVPSAGNKCVFTLWVKYGYISINNKFLKLFIPCVGVSARG